MKVLHTADWHLGQFKGPVEDGVNMRSLDTVKCLEAMVEKAKEEHPDMVVVSGDIFHQEQIGPNRYSDEVLTASRIIEELSSTTNFVVVMRGTPNHDGGGQFRVLRSLLAHNRKVSVITEPQVLRSPIADVVVIPGFDKQEFRAKFPGLSAEEENLTWTKYITDMVTGLKAQCTGFVPAILMSHYTVPGCNMESGQISFFSNFEPVIPQEALRTAGYDGVFLGHIHRPQQITGVDNTFYSGAINTMNFNDEGQVRGFWIHEFAEKTLVRSEFTETPYRKFATLSMSCDDVAAYIREGKMFLMSVFPPEKVADSIVRVRYTCTSEQKKALNVPMLQNDLYDLGAFYVSDIEAEATIDLANRGLLEEESDPLVNLKKWLEEKQFKNADKIVELAEPIIAAAMKESSTAEIHGVFRPVSIAVKNYRNYKEEHFDFADISFCTINGVNGAGKSSLFMDAIVDALYEETREGDNKAWIRGTEDARSGSIEFIFEIGTDRFRVVRTRMKSGRGTLNLSELGEDGEWMNLSKERVIDTQAEIERILGMDSMTFKSCALIMQDQYGLFLQTKKSERMAILGNLLGLGIYGAMELEARKQLKDANAKVAAQKEQVRTKQAIIDSKGNPEAELEEVTGRIALEEQNGATASKELSEINAKLEECKNISARLNDEKGKLSSMTSRENSLRSEIHVTEGTIEQCKTMLAQEEDVISKMKSLETARATVQEKSGDKAAYDAGNRALDSIYADIDSYESKSKQAKEKNAELKGQIDKLKGLAGEDYSEKISELTKAREDLEEMRARGSRYNSLNQKLNTLTAQHTGRCSRYSTDIQLTEIKLNSARESEQFMKDSGCPQVETATCKFLKKAKNEVSEIPGLEEDITRLNHELEEENSRYESEKSDLVSQLSKVAYDVQEETRLENLVKSLAIYEQLQKKQESYKAQIARLEADMNANGKIIEDCDGNVYTLNLRALTTTENVATLAESVKKHEEAMETVAQLSPYEKLFNNLPVFRERLNNANNNLLRLQTELESIQNEISERKATISFLEAEIITFGPDLEQHARAAEEKVQNISKVLTSLHNRQGALEQQIEDMEAQKDEIAILKKEILAWSEKAAWYETLKAAFSQDGVPHQIVRNIVPHIENVANNILSQMTGGSMGVEFVMERVVKGKDGDKATLDVLINEYGKTVLPYASKSGGEKVKASLAVILALAEIKTGSAGIQLGMLFIDEPPFLDDDGTQAYVDSLETIRQRYPDVKIMAITHDVAMKARFTQSVTVTKTEEGSKVIY